MKGPEGELAVEPPDLPPSPRVTSNKELEGEVAAELFDTPPSPGATSNAGRAALDEVLANLRSEKPRPLPAAGQSLAAEQELRAEAKRKAPEEAEAQKKTARKAHEDAAATAHAERLDRH